MELCEVFERYIELTGYRLLQCLGATNRSVLVGRSFSKLLGFVGGDTGQARCRLPRLDEGHFCQEDIPEILVPLIHQFIQLNR